MDVTSKHFKKYTVKLYILELEPENYHIFARGKWKGHPVNIIIDTGASHTCFDIDFFKSIDPEAFTTGKNMIIFRF
jgi:hypothetical protein